MSRRGWVNSGLVVVLILAGGLALYGYRSLQSDITQLTDARLTAESKAEDLRSQLQQNEQALTAARARLEHRTNSADKLEAELDRLRQTLAGAKADLQTAQQQVEKLKAQLETAQTALATGGAGRRAGWSAQTEPGSDRCSYGAAGCSHQAR